jgi:phosphoglycerate kinase
MSASTNNTKISIADVHPSIFKGKRVLLRVDFNVPQHKDLTISDDSRIRAAIPTIEHLRKAGAKIVLVSHLGRPKGPSEKHSLKPVSKRLSEILGVEVKQLSDCIGEEVEKTTSEMKDGDVCLLENIRFYAEEEGNDENFALKLAKLADIYVNDAFGTAHRAHASTYGVSKHLRPSLSGLLMHKEIKMLTNVVEKPERPFATVIGGSKVSTKIAVLDNLLDRVNILVIGGAMAFSFLKAQGFEVGKSLVEDDRLEFCCNLLDKAASKKVKIVLPVDVVVAKEFKAGVSTKIVDVKEIAQDDMGLDLGPKTIELIKKELSQCKTILWNGPLGAFETKGFEIATFALIDLLVELTKKGIKTVIGGGDSVAAIESKNIDLNVFTHVSTGGGASLEFLEGKELPGISCLDSVETAKSPV